MESGDELWFRQIVVPIGTVADHGKTPQFFDSAAPDSSHHHNLSIFRASTATSQTGE